MIIHTWNEKVGCMVSTESQLTPEMESLYGCRPRRPTHQSSARCMGCSVVVGACVLMNTLLVHCLSLLLYFSPAQTSRNRLDSDVDECRLTHSPLSVHVVLRGLRLTGAALLQRLTDARRLRRTVRCSSHTKRR